MMVAERSSRWLRLKPSDQFPLATALAKQSNKAVGRGDKSENTGRQLTYHSVVVFTQERRLGEDTCAVITEYNLGVITHKQNLNVSTKITT